MLRLLGYTSIGSITDTLKNPDLLRPDGSYAPAYELRDASSERAGRGAAASTKSKKADSVAEAGGESCLRAHAPCVHTCSIREARKLTVDCSCAACGGGTEARRRSRHGDADRAGAAAASPGSTREKAPRRV